MRQYDERLKERIFVGSDKRTLFGEGDPRGRFLFHGATPVTRLKAKEIRELGGGEFLTPIKEADADNAAAADLADTEIKAPAAPKAPHPNLAADTVAGVGPDFIVDWGRKYKGDRVGNLPIEYLEALTKGRNPADRKALAEVEIERRTNAVEAAPAAPPAPLNYGPEDTPNIGIHQDVMVKDLPEEFVNSLANGVDEAHKDWAATEIQRRKDDV